MKDPKCPHCGATVDLAEKLYLQHTTYWGEDEPKEHDCDKCSKTMFVAEYVSRWWTVGKTADEAADA